MRALSVRAAKLRAAIVVGVAVGAAAGALTYLRPRLLERGEAWTYDVRARHAAKPEQAAKDILMVDVDEQDIVDVERNFDLSFPWPRALFGYITRHVASGGPRAIVFDWFFQGRGALGVNDAAEFAAAMEESGRAVIGVYLAERPRGARRPHGRWAGKVASYATRKEARAAALKIMAFDRVPLLLPDDGGKTALWLGGEDSAEAFAESWGKLAALDELAEIFPREGDGPAPPPAPRELAATEEETTELTPERVVAELAGIDLAPPPGMEVRVQKALDAPLPILAAAAARVGNVVQRPDEDGVMRRHIPFLSYEGKLYPSLSLAAWMVMHPGVMPRFDRRTLLLGDTRVPLEEDGRFVVKFHGGSRVYPHVSAYKILRSSQQVAEGQEPEIPASTFKDKIVVVSATANALVDVRASPVERLHLGAAINTTALDNLMAGVTVRRVSRTLEALTAFGLSLVMALLMVAVWISIPSTRAALVATTGAMLLALGGYWVWIDQLLTRSDVWLAAATPMGGAALATFASMLVSSALERSDKRFVEKALNRYTSKALTRELMEHPEYLALGGARRDISVYFSDIAGFTTISEKLSAEQLVDLLNEYLTVMTDIIDEHDGYVDKYIGDAVMAFWGGLLPDPDHARKAVRAAIAMRNECVRRAPAWKARYGVDLQARSGVNSGEGVVGNMGSQNKYNYTAMGDMVNIASRLEGANKPYGTYLMISDSTYAHVREIVDVRELDFMTVKGKEQPITVYEVLEEKGKTDPELLLVIERFHEGRNLYKQRRFAEAIEAFKRAVVLMPDDGPSALYLARCQHFLDSPPPADWDGVWHMKEK